MLQVVGLAFGVGSSLATPTPGSSARDMTTDARAAFMLRVLALGRNGSTGLATIVVLAFH